MRKGYSLVAPCNVSANIYYLFFRFVNKRAHDCNKLVSIVKRFNNSSTSSGDKRGATVGESFSISKASAQTYYRMSKSRATVRGDAKKEQITYRYNIGLRSKL
tara:strand:+ start:505 stop:813 length:309 start_codon:yes stop_codon:yes gene_type:complete